MSSALSEQKLDTGELTSVLSPRLALQPRHLAAVSLFGALFLYFNFIPIYHSDIWGHVSYGQWILQHGELPTEDPFLRLAEGVPVICTAWLSQVLFGAAVNVGGDQWISNIFAITILAVYLILARAFYRQTGSLLIALIGCALVMAFGWTRHAIVRPETFGLLCFAALLFVATRANVERAQDDEERETPAKPLLLWCAVPILFALWANLHGSFVVGFAVLGCFLLGRAIEVFWTTRRIKAVVTDRLFWQWLVATDLAVVATLLNPYGIDLLIQTFTFASNPNLQDVMEWFSLEMLSAEGIEIGASWILLLVAFRHSRVRVYASDVLLIAVFTMAVVLRMRMVTWYAPVIVLVLVPHLNDISSRLLAKRDNGHPVEPTAVSFRYSLFCLLAIWVCFAFAPISQPILGGKPRPSERLYSRGSPVGLTKYLKENPPVGQILNPQWWGDFLVAFGPEKLEVFMTTNAVHVAPKWVWDDYMSLARAEAGWKERLDIYRVNTIVAHKELQPLLVRGIRRSLPWKIVYQDHIGLVAVREGSIPEPSKPAPSEPAETDDDLVAFAQH